MADISDRGETSPADSWAGQHRSRHRFWRWLLAVVIVLILLGAAGVGAILLQRSDSPLVSPRPTVKPSSAPSCPDATVHVAAAPEIAPVIEEAARRLNPAGAACGPVGVTAQEPAAVATATHRPDVWIPSSSAWLKMAGDAYTVKGEPLAYSPIVIAGPSPIANQFIKDGKTSWGGLTAGAASRQLAGLSMADPQQNTVGLLSVYAEHQAMSRTTTDAGIAQLQALTLRSRLEDAAADPARKLAQLATATSEADAAYEAGIFPVTEQQLAAYRSGKHLVSLTGAAPVDGLVEADYPFAVTSKSLTKAAKNDIGRLRAKITKSALSTAGFRTQPVAQALKLPDRVDDLLGPARQWVQYRTLNFQTLLLIDTSGSMNEQIKDKTGRTTTKAALLRQSGATAAQLFGDDTSLGLWLFGTPTASSPPHQEVIPLGPLSSPLGREGKTRRDALTAAMGQYRAYTTAGTPLYQSVLDGEADMQRQAKPGTVTLVIVLTDGDDGQSKYAMSQATFLKKLAAQRDPQRPVPIISVGYGPTADMKALGAMAQATGGQAIAATNPADLASAMAQAFLAAHLSN
jgi:Ca-activated chloride channel family protein